MGLLPWLQAQGYRCHWTSTDPSSCSRSWPTTWDRGRACEWGALPRYQHCIDHGWDIMTYLYRIPKFIVSAVPIIPMARSMLLQILAAWNETITPDVNEHKGQHSICNLGIIKNVARTCPVPTWPQYTTLAPMQLRSSLAAVNSSSAPPTMKVSLAELAAPTPGNEKLSSRGAQWF